MAEAIILLCILGALVIAAVPAATVYAVRRRPRSWKEFWRYFSEF